MATAARGAASACVLIIPNGMFAREKSVVGETPGTQVAAISDYLSFDLLPAAMTRANSVPLYVPDEADYVFFFGETTKRLPASPFNASSSSDRTPTNPVSLRQGL